MASDKEEILSLLAVDRLRSLADLWGVRVEDKRLKAPGIAKAIARKRNLRPDDVIRALTDAERATVAEELGLLPTTTAAELGAHLTGSAWRSVRRAHRDFSTTPERLRTTVVRVVDGDTIEVERVGSEGRMLVRLRGVDAPESHGSDKLERDVDHAGHDVELERRLGSAAATWLASRLPESSHVELDVERRADGSLVKLNHFRLLAFVAAPELDDSLECDIGLSLVTSGHGLVWPRNRPSRRYDHPRVQQYLEACNRAFRERPGLWNEGLLNHCPMAASATCTLEDCARNCAPVRESAGEVRE